MDIAKSLVRCVARAFYDTKHILVIDAIMIHSALRDDDLAHLLGTQTKELHKLCGKLREDRMVMWHQRQEAKEGQSRPVNRTYYYVDFRATIDAIKYRMYRLVKSVESKMNNDVDSKGYACPRCHKRYTPIDVLMLINEATNMFDCEVCGTTLVDDDDSDEIKQSQEQLGRLMGQVEKILSMLKKIDEVVVPANEFSDALAMAVPVSRERQGIANVPTPLPGAANGGNATPALEINFTSDKEKNAAQLAAEEKKRAAQAEQNALPVWHTQSTVSGDLTTLGSKEAAAKRARDAHEFKPKLEEEKKEDGQKDEVQQTAIEQYYAALRAKQAQEKAEEDEEDEDDEDEEGDDEDDDDDDAEFEDLPVGTGATNTGPPSGASTSKPPTPVPANISLSISKPSDGGGSSMKRSLPNDMDGESDSSSKSSLNPNKKNSGSTMASPAKRVKIQSPVKAEPDDDEDDSDEEGEFVDV